MLLRSNVWEKEESQLWTKLTLYRSQLKREYFLRQILQSPRRSTTLRTVNYFQILPIKLTSAPLLLTYLAQACAHLPDVKLAKNVTCPVSLYWATVCWLYLPPVTTNLSPWSIPQADLQCKNTIMFCLLCNCMYTVRVDKT